MKNLSLTRYLEVASNPGSDRYLGYKCSTGVSNDIYFFLNGLIRRLDSTSGCELNSLIVPVEDVLSLSFCLLENSLMLILRNGDLVLIDAALEEGKNHAFSMFNY